MRYISVRVYMYIISYLRTSSAAAVQRFLPQFHRDTMHNNMKYIIYSILYTSWRPVYSLSVCMDYACTTTSTYFVFNRYYKNCSGATAVCDYCFPMHLPLAYIIEYSCIDNIIGYISSKSKTHTLTSFCLPTYIYTYPGRVVAVKL